MLEKKEMVIDTGPLIALVAATGSLEVLKLLYSCIVVPHEVCQEIITGGRLGFAVPEFQKATWLDKRPTMQNGNRR